MPRATVTPTIEAVISVLSTIDVGYEDTVVVGDASSPNHELPFLVVRQVSSQAAEGSFLADDQDADEALRVQVTGFGETRHQADWMRDQARAALTKAALDTALSSSSRRLMYCHLDMSLHFRDERNLPRPLFVATDQYLIKTTPV